MDMELNTIMMVHNLMDNSRMAKNMEKVCSVAPIAKSNSGKKANVFD